jgi:hypothetical protein
MKRFSRVTWAMVAAMLMGAAAQARAGALDNCVPQESIAYFGWAGSDALQAPYAGSNLKGIIDASAAKDFINKTLPKLIDQAAARDPDARKQIEKLETGLGIAWRHPVAFYFCPVSFSNPQRPEFRFGLVCDAGADAKSLSDLLKGVFNEIPPNVNLPIHVVLDGNTVLLTFGRNDLLADLKKGGGLAAAPAYQAAMAKVNLPAGVPAMAAYADMTKAIAQVNEALAKLPDVPADAKEKLPVLLDTFGVNGLTQMALVSGFDGKGWTDQSFVGMSGPKKGFLALMDSPPISNALLALVPKDAVAFSAWKLDLQKILTETRAAISKVDLNAQQQLDNGLKQANQELGLDIEKDFFAPLGDEWVLYEAPLSDEGGNSAALVCHLKDGAKFAKTLAAIEKMYNNIPDPPLKVEKITAAKTQVSTLALGTVSVAWVVKNDNLYISSLSGIGGAIRHVENKAPSILENATYQAARAALPADAKPVSLAYAEPAKLYPELRKMVVGFFPLLRQRANLDVPMDLLPETADIKQFLTPGVGMSWIDASGMHAMSKTAFPGAGLLGGQQTAPSMAAAVVGVGVAVALPAMAQSRQLAGKTVDAASLRGMSQASLLFAADNNDNLPDDVARLVADGIISPKQLVSRRSGTTPLQMTPELDKLAKDNFAQFATQIAAHCDYVYLGKGLKAEMDGDVVVLYEKPGPHTPDGLNLAFQDSHVEFVRWAGMQTAFEATNTYLKKNSKPVVDVKAMLRAAGVADPGMP